MIRKMTILVLSVSMISTVALANRGAGRQARERETRERSEAQRGQETLVRERAQGLNFETATLANANNALVVARSQRASAATMESLTALARVAKDQAKAGTRETTKDDKVIREINEAAKAQKNLDVEVPRILAQNQVQNEKLKECGNGLAKPAK